MNGLINSMSRLAAIYPCPSDDLHKTMKKKKLKRMRSLYILVMNLTLMLVMSVLGTPLSKGLYLHTIQMPHCACLHPYCFGVSVHTEAGQDMN